METQTSRLLVVDDEKIVCDSCTRILSNQGFSVETSTDPRRALQLVSQNKYAAILLDIKMPAIDGLEFLEELRKRNINAPVIIITGYSSVQNAVAAMKLGAADFVPKPFTPEELYKAVSKLIPREESIQEKLKMTDVALQPLPSLPIEAEPQILQYSKEYYFMDESWVQKTNTETVRVGAFLSSVECMNLASIQLPNPGDKIYRGLPLARLAIEGKGQHLIPSPITGIIIKVNDSINGQRMDIWQKPCSDGWIALIEPENLEEDLKACHRHSMILMNAKDEKKQEQIEILTNLGCSVQVAGTAAAVSEAMKKEKADLVILDTSSYGKEGLAVVSELNNKLPGLKIVAIAQPDSPFEKDYRLHKILYYAIEPLAEMEMVDILNSVFAPVRKPAPEIAPSRNLPNLISKISITNHHSKKIDLLVSGEILMRHKGVGLQLHDLFLNNSYPITVTMGAKNYDVIDVIKEVNDCDELIFLESRDMEKVPGSIMITPGCALMKGMPGSAESIKTLTVQPENGKNVQLVFDARLSKAIAEFILREMTSN